MLSYALDRLYTGILKRAAARAQQETESENSQSWQQQRN
jgi:hypothetical protein